MDDYLKTLPYAQKFIEFEYSEQKFANDNPKMFEEIKIEIYYKEQTSKLSDESGKIWCIKY